MPTAATPSPSTSTPEANIIVSSPATSVPPVKGAPLIKNVGTCHANARTRYGTRRRGADSHSSSRHGFGLKVYPARIKNAGIRKEKIACRKGEEFEKAYPTMDQDNCNALSNINPVEPFTPPNTPFKTEVTKKPRPPRGPGLINDGAPWRIRTVDLGIRSPLLYPTELMEQITARKASASSPSASNYNLVELLAVRLADLIDRTVHTNSTDPTDGQKNRATKLEN